MNFCVIATTVLLGLTIVLAPAALDTAASESQRTPNTRLAQASQDAAGATTNNLQGIGLTASHKRIIYDNIASEQPQTFSGDPQLAVGNTIPDSLMLNTMPIAVKDQIGLLKDFKFVKLMGDQYFDRRSSQPEDCGYHHQARRWTMKQAWCGGSWTLTLCKHATSWRQFGREHLVQATAIEIDNFKAPAVFVEAIAHPW